MTTYFPFQPSNQGSPTFQPTLDGNPYSCVVTWNLFGQRYYLNCYDQTNTLAFCVPLIETDQSILLEGLSFDPIQLLVTATTNEPHGYDVGDTVALTIAGASPSGYDGLYQCLITGPDTFTYPLGTNPGQVFNLTGSASYLISLCAGYFDSTLVYRNNQFEVTP